MHTARRADAWSSMRVQITLVRFGPDNVLWSEKSVNKALSDIFISMPIMNIGPLVVESPPVHASRPQQPPRAQRSGVKNVPASPSFAPGTRRPGSVQRGRADPVRARIVGARDPQWKQGRVLTMENQILRALRHT
jgi:hypothetical protein